MIQEGFINITPRLQETQQSIKPDEITLQINGFANIVKTLTDDQLKDSSAYKVVLLMDKIFHEEKKMRDAKLSPMTIKEQRQSDPYQTLITNLESYIDSIHPEKDSSLDKAISYYKKMNGE